MVCADDFTSRGGHSDGAIGAKSMYLDRLALELRVPSVRLLDGSSGGGSVASMVPDPETAARYISPELKITFTGGRTYGHPRETAAFNAKRYRWVKKKMERTDVVLILGANDVVNPDARTNKASPLYGMPIINADFAKNTIVVKRSMNTGFAGTDNPLFYKDNNRMLFGDAKKVLTSLIAELKKT